MFLVRGVIGLVLVGRKLFWNFWRWFFRKIVGRGGVLVVLEGKYGFIWEVLVCWEVGVGGFGFWRW